MDLPKAFYPTLYFLSLLISLTVGGYAWKRRSEIGAFSYAFVAFSQGLWTCGYILELLSPDLEGKIFWDNFQFIGAAGWQVAFLAFTLQYTGRKVAHFQLLCSLLALPGLAIVILAFTDPLHHLIRPTVWLIPGEPYAALLYPFTTAIWLSGIYGYAIIIICMTLLITYFARAYQLYKFQVGLILVGNLIPIIGTIFTLSGLIQNLLRDITPYTFAVGNLLVAWGLFRYHTFDILPIARDTLIERLDDAVYVIDAQNRLIDINPAACQAIGRSIAEVIGRPADEVFAAWPELVNRFRDMVQYTQLELDVQNELGYRSIELRFQPILDHHQQLVGRVIMAHDITNRKLAEQELKRRTLELEAANERLTALSRVKDEFVSNVSHELRTPLTNLKLYVGLLTTRPERGQAYMLTLKREMERLENMIESLLALSRFDQNRMALPTTQLDLNALVQEYTTDRAALAESKKLTLILTLEPNLPVLWADRNLIGQVISILLTNAINYTPAGGQITLATHQKTTNDGLMAGFRVSDSGPGIPPEEQSQLFSRFFRGQAGRESTISGTGLGLALAKEIVTRYQGYIEVFSEGVPGKGATFQVWLNSM